MAVAARQRFAFFFSRDFNLVASAVNEHWHQEQYVFKIVFFPRLWMFCFSIYFRFFFLPFVIFLFFAVLMITISVTLMTPSFVPSLKKDVLILNTNSVTYLAHRGFLTLTKYHGKHRLLSSLCFFILRDTYEQVFLRLLDLVRVGQQWQKPVC